MLSEEERSIRKLQLLAPKIRDHKDLETKLTSAPPSLRTIIYEIVKPCLKFKAHPLDKYVARAGEMAEREQLPILDAQGNLHDFRVAEKAIAAELATLELTLVCSKCTKAEKFFAVGRETNVDVVVKARAAGWIYDYTVKPEVEICPDCPTSLRKFDA